MLGNAEKTDPSQLTRPEFEIVRHELDEQTCMISVTGDLDLSSAPQLKWTLVDSLEDGHDRMILELSPATFMDSTALGVLIGVNRSLAAGARLAIVCSRSNVLNVFELSGMDGAFAIFPTLAQALAYVQESAD